MFATDFHEWTSCEVHGHDFSDDEGGFTREHCADCGQENLSLDSA